MLYELCVESVYSKGFKATVKQLEIEKETEKTYRIKSGSRGYRTLIHKKELGVVQHIFTRTYVIWFTDLATLEEHKKILINYINDIIENYVTKVEHLNEMKDAVLEVK